MSAPRDHVPVTPRPVETAHEPWLSVDPVRASGRILWDGGVRQSYVDVADPTHLEFVYTRRIADAVDTVLAPGAVVRAVHLGGGALTVARWLAATRPGSTSTVFEIDPAVAAVAVSLGAVPGVRVHVQEGGAGLAGSDPSSAELVVCDAFTGRAVPVHLVERTFLADVARVLTGTGAYVLNVIDDPPFARLRLALHAASTVWPEVGLIAAPELLAGDEGGNVVVIASHRPVDWAGMAARTARRDDQETVLTPAATTRWCNGIS